jgi:CDP-2,3-bis-(O-geranylgeranyl)-sn-glycerol synthase
MINLLFLSFWYFLPAGIANLVPPLAVHLPGLKHWNTPLDLGYSYRSTRIFGDHKTWRGLTTGILCGTFISYLQAFFIDPPADPILLGFLLSLGALLGDAVKSFFKRRTHVPPGKSWFPFDQLDYIAGGLILSSFYYTPPPAIYFGVIILYFGLHLAVSYLGYLLKIKPDPL